jgi:DNA-binding transcriptional LysR family regulator
MQNKGYSTMRFHLADLEVFIRIAQLGSLSAVARERDLPVSQITRALVRLEAACGVQLIHRTTHGLSLTDEGDALRAQGIEMLESADGLGGQFVGKRNAPSGWVRVGASTVIAQSVLAPSLAALTQRYPSLHIEIAEDDRISDMVRDGIDVAIRTGQVSADTLVARRIGSASRSLYASPSYLKKFGTPKHPDDLRNHRLIGNSRAPELNLWPRADTRSSYAAVASTRANSSATVMSLVRSGAGVSRLMDLAASPLVASGELVPLLKPFFDQEDIPIFAVMLQERHRLPKVRACIDYWEEIFSAQSREFSKPLAAR